MNKYILTLIVAAGIAVSAHSGSAHAQQVVCPYGYTCVPIAQVAVVCPYGYTCTPINNSYPPINSYPSYPTYPTCVYNCNTAGPLRITMPNGGDTWQLGTSRTITWTSPAYFRATYADLKLIRSNPTCSYGYACPMIAYAPYTIATGISINQDSYNWTVGQVQYQNPSLSSLTTAPEGQYTVQICETGTSNCDSSDSSFTITGSNTYPGSQAPVISGIDAPTTLAINQTGTWTVHATDNQNGTLNYSVDWGDLAIPTYNMMTAAGGQFTQTTSFTHSYTTTGTYTVTFTVKNSAGLTAQSRVTVYVGTSANTQPLTVITPNGGETWKKGTMQNIVWSTQNASYPYYTNYNNNTGTVRITLDYRCPMGMYCIQMTHPTYIVQNSAPNSGTSAWYVGNTTLDGSSVTTVPNGTYVVTVCRYDTTYTSTPAACDTSDSYFTLTD